MAKSRIEKLAALFVGVFLMLGSTLAFAATTTNTLEAYPAPFLQDGKLNGATIVIGRDAASSDVVGAVEIGARLQAQATTKAEVKVDTKEPIVSGGKSERVELGSKVNTELGTELDDSDIDGLKDGKIEFEGDNYDYKEIVMLGDDLKVVTSLTTGDEDYKDNVAMEIRENSIKYQYRFEDNIDFKDISEDEPLDIEFLGEHLKIIDADDNSITVQLGKEIFLKQGESYAYKDDKNSKSYEIKLLGVSSDSDKAIITVDDVQRIIDVDDEEEFGNIAIRVQEAFSNKVGNDAVVLIIGTDTRVTYDDGDEFIGENKNDPEWVWDLQKLLSNDKDQIVLGVTYDMNKDSADDDPISVGECYTLPNDYIKICLNSLSEKEYSEYSLEFDKTYSDISDVYAGKTNEPVFLLKTKEESGIKTPNNKETGELVLWMKDATHLEVLYMNEKDNKVYSDAIYAEGSGTVKIATMKYKDTALNVELDIPADFTSSQVTFRIVSPVSNDNLSVPLTVTSAEVFRGIGTLETSEPTDSAWNGVSIGTRDEDALTKYGIKIVSPESNADRDRVRLEIPGDQVEANVVASGVKTTINTLTGDAGFYVNKFETNKLAVLDNEISDYKDYNVIVVGGPCANDVAAAILGSSTEPEECAKGFTEGKAMIKFIADTGKGKSALIVAGYSADDTRNAANAFVNKQSDLKGSEMTIVSKGNLFSYELKAEPMMSVLK